MRILLNIYRSNLVKKVRRCVLRTFFTMLLQIPVILCIEYKLGIILRKDSYLVDLAHFAREVLISTLKSVIPRIQDGR